MGIIVVKARQARLDYQARVGRVVTIQDVADQIGVTRVYLSNIERSMAWPNEQALAGLCDVYGVQPGDLLEYRRSESAVPEPTERG